MNILLSSLWKYIVLRDPSSGVQRSNKQMFNPCYITTTGAVGNPTRGCDATNAAFQQEARPRAGDGAMKDTDAELGRRTVSGPGQILNALD